MASRTKKPADAEGPYYYSCEHQTSNEPCPEGCNGPDAETMPADWADDYRPPER